MNWNIVSTSDLDKYQDDILKMYEASYEAIGVIDFGGWNGMKAYLNCSCYLLSNETEQINGIILYWLSDYGNKISLVISRTPDIAKSYVVPKLVELLQTPGFYVELSDALEYLVVTKHKLQNIKDKSIIKLLIPTLMDKDIFDENDENDERCRTYQLNKQKNMDSPSGSYLREIPTIGLHRKALYGMPCLNKLFEGDGCNRKCISRGGKNKKSMRKKKYKRKSTRLKYKK